MPSCAHEERLRKERRSRTVIGIRVVHPVRVEPDLVVVGVEERGVHELAVRVRSIAFVHP